MVADSKSTQAGRCVGGWARDMRGRAYPISDVTKRPAWPKVVARMHHLLNLFHKIYDVQGLVAIGGLALIGAVIFAETGLLVGFFLPGDSLLVTAGIYCTSANPQNEPLLNIVTLNLVLLLPSRARPIAIPRG